MIIVRCTDGIGNQLFQYAIGRSLAHQFQTSLFIDNNHFLRNSHREFSLPYFKTRFSTINNFKIFALKHPVKFFKMKFGFTKHLKEESGIYFSNSEFTKNSFLEGYWGNEKYFNGIRGILLREFQIRDEYKSSKFLVEKDIIDKNPDSVSIHIRRGDYLGANNQSIFENLGWEYYKRGIGYILSLISNPIFYIFSDDINWVKENFPILGTNNVYVNEFKSLKDFEELMLMSYCKHNIIANSTFSWWAAWLNLNENKIVIQPKIWYKAKSFQKAYELNQTLYSKKFIRI